ncbi:MAG: hypothetical protein Fur0020_13270 [Thermodesulfovibrionia bacterium]
MSKKNDTGQEGFAEELSSLRKELSGLKHLVRELRKDNEMFRSLIESADDSIYLVDNNYCYLFMNRKHLSRLGLSGDDYIGKTYKDFHNPEEVREFTKKVDKVIKTGVSLQYEYRSTRDNRYFLQTFSPVRSPDGDIAAVAIISKDITDRKRMEEELRELSLTDELTGLLNRRGFFVHVEQYLKIVRRQKSGILMLYADLDNLKGINDRYGHREGDLALIQVARILKENYRESDIIARIGGDEFVVIPVGSSGDCIDIISSRLLKAVDAYNSRSQKGYRLSLSFGIACYDPQNPCSIDELLSSADKRMYENKALKKRQIS